MYASMCWGVYEDICFKMRLEECLSVRECVCVCVHGARTCSSSRESDKYVEKWEPVYDFYF